MTWSQGGSDLSGCSRFSEAASKLGSDGTEAFGALSVASDSRQDLPCDSDALL